jgi:hypothetical protein
MDEEERPLGRYRLGLRQRAGGECVLVTLTHPSASPRCFHTVFSSASASRGNMKLAALSAATWTTSTTIALIA